MMKDLPILLKKLSPISDIIIITDTLVTKFYGTAIVRCLQEKGFTTHIFTLPYGEDAKSFSNLERLAYAILDKKITKRTLNIVLGGGVVGNIGGFISALLFRGIRYIHIPTTIMHQADASIGGKQAINTYHGKNTIGTFYEPEFIYNDITTIKTLSERQYYNGFAEIIKHGLCQSHTLIKLLLSKKTSYATILKKTIDLKTDILMKDPRELNEGYILIYGHTIGHPLEKLSRGTLLHGEAISIGMIIASEISYTMGYAKKSLIGKHKKILQAYHLPICIPKEIKKDDILAMLSYDKKEKNKEITFCLLKEIGKPVIKNQSLACEVPLAILEEVLTNNYEK